MENTASTAVEADNNQWQIPTWTAIAVRAYPHDPKAFTQGLEYCEGFLYESTGVVGESTLRKVSLEEGKVLKKISLPSPYFGEGLTILRGKIYQLTWLSKTGFIYDLHTFRKIGEFRYESEGWGLTHDHESLLLSDGTNKIRVIEPATFRLVRTIEVYAGHEAVTNLNELEYINGEIYANIWHTNKIARINPHSGEVLAWIDLTAIAGKEQHGSEDVLNGIAYDHDKDRLFVTGKDWAGILEIKIEKK